MVSLDGKQPSVQTLPNKYVYNIPKKLSPSDYQSVLSAEFVFFFSLDRSFEAFSVDRYQIEDLTSRQKSVEAVKVYTTAVYTALLYNTNDNKVG